MTTVRVKCCPFLFDTDDLPPTQPNKVFSNSPAQGELQRGDVLVSINDKDANTLSHKQAQDHIKHGGGQIDLVVNRPPPGNIPVQVIKVNRPHAPATTPKSPSLPDFRQHTSPQMPPPRSYGHQPRTQKPIGGGGPEFGSAYGGQGGYYGQPQYASQPTSRPVGGPMLDRVQQSLDNINLSPRNDYAPSPFGYDAPAPEPYRAGPPQEQEEEEEFVPIAERKKAFQGAPTQPQPVVRSVRAPVSFQPTSGQSFGTDYSRMPNKPQHVSAPQAPRPVAVTFQSQPAVQKWQAPSNSELDTASHRAWEGTLKSQGLKPWERDALEAGELPEHLACQSQFEQEPQRYTQPHQQSGSRSQKPPPFNPTQSPAIDLTEGEQDGPRVVHLQYNSPMGMYSDANVQETLQGQTAAASAGQPSAPVLPPQLPGEKQRDWSQSAVFRMLHGTDGKSNQARGGMPAKKTSVQVQLQSSGGRDMDDEVGVSDF